MRFGNRMVVLATVTVVSLGACGSQSKGTKPNTPTSVPAVDLAAAMQALLTRADAPPGFDAVPHQPGSGLPEAAKHSFAQCLGVDHSLLDDTPGAEHADSPDFQSRAGNNALQTRVEVAPNRAALDFVFTELASPRMARCIESMFRGLFKQQAPNARVVQLSVTPFGIPNVGDRARGVHGDIVLANHGQNATLSFDLMFASTGRALARLESSSSKPLKRAVEVGLVQKMISRVDQSIVG
ncbi:MAG TPA: hypothetical protein VFR41_07420 [Acidimicrobiia bacterium]|nr:hypothetical protein [Acidimicrobiia bacterium]